MTILGMEFRGILYMHPQILLKFSTTISHSTRTFELDLLAFSPKTTSQTVQNKTGFWEEYCMCQKNVSSFVLHTWKIMKMPICLHKHQQDPTRYQAPAPAGSWIPAAAVGWLSTLQVLYIFVSWYIWFISSRIGWHMLTYFDTLGLMILVIPNFNIIATSSSNSFLLVDIPTIPHQLWLIKPCAAKFCWAGHLTRRNARVARLGTFDAGMLCGAAQSLVVGSFPAEVLQMLILRIRPQL